MPTIEELKPRAAPFLAPISPDAPAGKSAKMEPIYEEVDKEAAKLTGLTGGKIDWPGVVEKGSQILQKHSKDLRIAAFVSYGLYATQGIDGLVTGTVTMAEMIETFWPSMFPEATRMKGRVGALQWLLDRLGENLPTRKVTGQDKAPLEALEVAARRLAEVARAKYGSDCPAMGPTMEAVGRLKANLAEEAKPPPPPPPQASSAPAAAPAAQAPAPAAAAASAPAAASALADPAKAADFLRQVGSSLIDAAAMLRKANPADPTPYRILRTGLLIHMAQAPGTGGKSQVPPMAEALRNQLDQMAGGGKWPELLELSESTLSRTRLALDLHRYSAVALQNLGEPYKAARTGLIAELGALLKRLPDLIELQAADGSPLASTETRSFIANEVLPRGGGGAVAAAAPSTGSAPVTLAPVSAADPKEMEWVADVRKLLTSKKEAEALQLGNQKAQTAATGRARFIARLELARLCATTSQKALARTMYEALEQESLSRHLDEWDPALSAACLEGLFALIKIKEMAPADLAVRARRLALLDPVAALRANG